MQDKRWVGNQQQQCPTKRASADWTAWGFGWAFLILGTLSACTSVPLSTPAPPKPSMPAPTRPATSTAPVATPGAPLSSPGAVGAALPPAATRSAPDDTAGWSPVTSGTPRSRWLPARWVDLPGWPDDAFADAWNAWARNCENPARLAPMPNAVTLCDEARRLTLGSATEQRDWLMTRFQPWRIESLTSANPEGLLTAYYEPVFEAKRTPQAGFGVPLYRAPAGVQRGRPWFTRQEIDTLPQAQAALRGQEIAWLADPIDALVLHIQGSGRLRITQADGRVQMLRVAFAATNEQPYRSVGRWLLDQGAITDASWPGIKAWVRANPHRVQEMLWANPRYVFFREEPLSDLDASFGPRGALGVALTPGRSIAVDPLSIPYGTPLWLHTPGPTLATQRLVFAQDTGSAIVGGVRGDYFMGWGDDAGEVAGRLKQPLQLWALWPR
jgi:membrane-bound lytic murein transglycosylase A